MLTFTKDINRVIVTSQSIVLCNLRVLDDRWVLWDLVDDNYLDQDDLEQILNKLKELNGEK